MKIKQRPVTGTATICRRRHKVVTRQGSITAYPGDYIVDVKGVPAVYSVEDFEKLFTFVDQTEKPAPEPDPDYGRFEPEDEEGPVVEQLELTDGI
jgi:hypothetical protein